MKIEIDSKDLKAFIRSVPPFDTMTEEEFWAICSMMATLEMARLEEEAGKEKQAKSAVKSGGIPPTASMVSISAKDIVKPADLLGIQSGQTLTITPPKIKVDWNGGISTESATPTLASFIAESVAKGFDSFDNLNNLMVSGVGYSSPGEPGKPPQRMALRLKYNGNNRVACVKYLRSITGWGLKQAVDFITAAPKEGEVWSKWLVFDDKDELLVRLKNAGSPTIPSTKGLITVETRLYELIDSAEAVLFFN